MDKKPKHRWFAFRLRTLLVVVAVTAACLAYPFNWIAERRRFFDEVPEPELPHGVATGSYSVAAPLILRLCGQRGIGEIYLQPDVDERTIERAKRLFPEAILVSLPPQGKVRIISEPTYHSWFPIRYGRAQQ